MKSERVECLEDRFWEGDGSSDAGGFCDGGFGLDIGFFIMNAQERSKCTGLDANYEESAIRLATQKNHMLDFSFFILFLEVLTINVCYPRCCALAPASTVL